MNEQARCRALMPGLGFTHHQLGALDIEIEEARVRVGACVTATHTHRGAVLDSPGSLRGRAAPGGAVLQSAFVRVMRDPADEASSEGHLAALLVGAEALFPVETDGLMRFLHCRYGIEADAGDGG